METILISALFSMQVHYADPQTCKEALKVVQERDPKAFCIPAGKTKDDLMFERFFDLIQNLSKKDTISVDKESN